MKEKILIYDPRPFMIEGDIACTSGIVGITSKKQYKVEDEDTIPNDKNCCWITDDNNNAYLVFMPSHGWKLYIKGGNLLYEFKTEKL